MNTQHKTTRFHRSLSVCIIATIGLALAWASHYFVDRFLNEMETLELEERISHLTIKIQDEINLESALLDNMVTALSIQQTRMSQAYFIDLAAKIMHKNQAISHLYIVNQSDDRNNFIITHHYTTQHDNASNALGTAAGQHFLTRQPFNQIIADQDSGALITSDNQQLIIYKPVVTLSGSREPGVWLVAQITIDNQLGTIIRNNQPDWLDVRIFTGNMADQFQLLYSTTQTPYSEQTLYQPSAHALFIPGSIVAHGVPLSVLYTRNNHDGLIHFYKRLPFPGLIILITLVICAYVYAQHLWHDRTQQLIDERTRELSDAKAALTEEAKAKLETLKKLTASEEEIRTLMHSIDGVIWESKPDYSSFSYISPQVKRLTGYTPEQIIKNPELINQFAHEEDRALCEKKLGEAIQDKNTDHVEVEYRSRCLDGSTIWLKSIITLLRNKQGQVLNLRGVTMDVTAFKETLQEKEAMEAQMRQTQKLEAIGQLAAGIAHEINTPAQFVGDNLHFLGDAFKDIGELLLAYQALETAIQENKPLATTVDKIVALKTEIDSDELLNDIPDALSQSLEGTERISSIVKAMKEFSHPGSADKKAVDLNQAISNTITVARNEWKYVARMETNFDNTLPLVHCLAGEFNQVILNMIVNAAHAIADRQQQENNHELGAITIATRVNGNFAEITLADTGYGIPEEHLEQIFLPFFTTKEVGKGTGQGLAIAYSVITDKHQGSMSVTSKVGKGSTFTIQLPIAAEPDITNDPAPQSMAG